MMLETEKELKRRKLQRSTSISSETTVAIITIILSFAVLMTTYITSISLSQSSFAKMATTNTNANQKPAAVQQSLSQVEGLITPSKLTDSTGQGPEYVGAPCKLSL